MHNEITAQSIEAIITNSAVLLGPSEHRAPRLEHRIGDSREPPEPAQHVRAHHRHGRPFGYTLAFFGKKVVFGESREDGLCRWHRSISHQEGIALFSRQ